MIIKIKPKGKRIKLYRLKLLQYREMNEKEILIRNISFNEHIITNKIMLTSLYIYFLKNHKQEILIYIERTIDYY